MEDLGSRSKLIPSVYRDGDAVVIAVSGEIDLHNSPELRTELLDLLNRQRPQRLIIDLTQVPYIDSSALAVLVEALKRILKTAGKVCLVGLQPRVKGLLEIARLSSIFVICATVDEAKTK